MANKLKASDNSGQSLKTSIIHELTAALQRNCTVMGRARVKLLKKQYGPSSLPSVKSLLANMSALPHRKDNKKSKPRVLTAKNNRKS